MKKHIRLTILILLALILGSVAAVRAEILPPHGDEGRPSAVPPAIRLTAHFSPLTESPGAPYC